jgi:hypothetical protein
MPHKIITADISIAIQSLMGGEGSGGYGGRKSKKQKEAEIVKKNNGGHGVLTSIFEY